MEDKNSIIIDFTNIDMKTYNSNERILHKNAYEEVISLLKDDVQCEIDDEVEFEDFYRTHNAIFVEGGRGSGKTQFLLSLKRCKNTYYRDDKDIKKMYFIGPIDPTILHDNESFLTIVLARILNQIESNLKNIKEYEKKNFYELLKSISFAIDGVINKRNSDRSALEYIAQDQSSLKLEHYLHNFFHEVSKIVGNKRLVLLIDDIDMAFDKGFEILEVIRKYLSSPYLIPIVTGDKWLYEDILEKHFFKKLDTEYFRSKYYKNNFNMNTYSRDTVGELQKDYLTKILPQHRRVKLETLYELSKENRIVFKYNNSTYLLQRNNKDCFFFKIIYYKAEVTKNDFMEQLFSNSLRKITQFLHGEYNSSSTEEQHFNLIDLNSIKEIAQKYNLNNIVFLDKDIDLFQKGLEEFQQGVLEPALENFKESYKLQESLKTLKYIGLTYSAQADYKSAIKFFQKFIEKEPEDAEIIYKLGYSFSQLYRYQEGIENYQKVLKLLPDNAHTYNSIGLNHVALEEYEKAFISYKEAIALKTQYYKPYLNIFEIALTVKTFFERHKKEIERLKIEFKKKFKEDAPAMKFFSMLEQLEAIATKRISEKKIESNFDEWFVQYESTVVGTWNFDTITKWASTIEDEFKRDILIRYIEKFQKVM